HLFAHTEEQAVQMKQALDDGMNWEEVARLTFMDSSLAFNGGRLGWVGFGDMEPELESAAYQLVLNEISEPLRTRFGYHLLQVTNVRKNIMISADDFQRKKPRLERTLRTRKEKEFADKYVGEFMKVQNVVMRNESFDLIVAHIRDDVMDNRTAAQLNLPALRDGELMEMKASLSDYAGKTFITFVGGEWTIGDFLAKLRALPQTRRPKMKSPQQFRRDIGIMIRDDFLAAEARNLHLEKDPLVSKEVRRAEDQYVFSRFWQSIQDTITISSEETLAWYQQHSERYWVPEQVHVREILLSSPDEVRYVLNQLQQEVAFESLALELSLRRGTVKNGGDLGWLTSAQMGNIGATACRLKNNQIAGPVEVDGGFSIIQNLGRRAPHVLAFEEAAPLVERQLQKERSQTIYHNWVSRLAMETRISINDSLLSQLGAQLEEDGWVPMPGVRPVY
ncbi:peptidylprolyl isomerase, partial [bacterium]|nr:peptidylprolyl isomerase [bacterium]